MQFFRKASGPAMFGFCIALAIDANSQQNNSIGEPTNIATAIPPSPDAAALGKFGDVQVGYYTGIPNISIPLYDIKSQDISVPMSIDYFAGGIKVEETASSVGLGWALSAGGVITRTVRGLPDECPNGYINGLHYVDSIVGSSPGKGNFDLNCTQIANGAYDGQPDIFCYNFCGHSGKFVLDQSGKPHLIPSGQVSIQYTVASYNINTFTLVTPDGVKYAFNAMEITKSTNSCGSGTFTQVATAWFLSTITNPGGTSVIHLNYQQNSFTNSTLKSTTLYQFDHYENTVGASVEYFSTPPSYNPSCTNGNLCQSQKLVSIDFNNGHVYFYTDSTRKDFSSVPMYTRIAIQSNDQKFKKQYRLSYGYFNAGLPTARLRLDSVEEVTYDPAYADTLHFLTVGSYKLAYNNSVALPSTTSCAQDTWGFFNGELDNDNIPTLSPQMLYTQYGTGYPMLLAGAKREVDTVLAQAGVLTSITYPTGGASYFTYESNREAGLNTYNFTRVGQIAAAGDDNNGYFDVITDSADIVLSTYGSGLYNHSNPQNTDFITGEVYLVGSAGQDSVAMFPIWNGDSAYLVPPGHYQVVRSNPKNQNITTTIQLWWSNDDTVGVSNNQLAGGLRIKKIVDSDPVTGATKTRNFSYYIGSSDASSGALVNLPTYSYFWKYTSLGYGGQQPYDLVYFVRTGISNYPLATTQGAPVGYSQVTVTYDSSGQNGKTEYYYGNAVTGDIDVVWANFPFAPNESHDWRRGNLLEQIDYMNSGGTYIKLQDKVNVYWGQGFNGVPGVTCAFSPTPVQNAPWDTLTVINTPITFYTPYEWWYLQSDTTKTYSNDGSGNYAVTWHTYQYDSTSYLPSQIATADSKGRLVNTYMTYPGDYANSISGVASLYSEHILTPVIEKYQQLENSNGTNPQITAGFFTSYKPTIPKPDTIFEIENTVGLTAFKPSAQYTSISSIALDTSYRPFILNTAYDRLNNPIQQSKIYGANICYIWDYLGEYPIARVANAKQADIAYTSFEADGSGNWTIPSSLRDTANYVTGTRSYLLSNGAVSASGLTSSNTYIVSYWSKSGAYSIGGGSYITGKTISGWTYYEHTITGVTSLSVSGSGNIDELRLYPKTAQMTTYTYEPLAGMTSQCDLNNRITYYKYDVLGRLVTVQDQDLNYIKKICYNYYGQASLCSPVVYNNATQSQSFTRNNCGTGYAGSTVTYTVPAGRYSSPVSQAAANQLAQNDINANGQNYANANGTCSSTVTVSASNLVGVAGFTAVYTNTSTSQQYTFTVAAAGGAMGQVPVGTYNIAISKSGNTTSFAFGTCGVESTSGTSATLYNIVVANTNCNVIIIDSLN